MANVKSKLTYKTQENIALSNKFNVSYTLNDAIAEFDELKKIVKNSIPTDEEKGSTEKSAISDDVLIQWGIDSEEALEKAFSNRAFADEFCRESSHDIDRFEYVQRILKRSGC